MPTKGYFERCSKALETGHNNIFRNTYETLFLRLHPAQHPYARHVMFHLPGGIRLKGLLALKGDLRKRPLVILRLGIFSNTQEFFPERYLFMQMFEQESVTAFLTALQQTPHILAMQGKSEGVWAVKAGEEVNDNPFDLLAKDNVTIWSKDTCEA